MRKKRLSIIIAIALIFAMCFSTATASAKSLTDIQKEIKEKKQELDKGEEEADELISEINKLEEAISSLDDQIRVSEDKLVVLEDELAKAQKKVDVQNEELSDRLRAMYKNGSIGFFDVIMNSGSFSEFLTNFDLVQAIYASDKEVLEDLQKAYDEVEKKKKEVETLQAELKSSKALAKEEKADIESQKKEVLANNEELAEKLEDLESEADAIAAELAAKSKSGSISSSGTSKYSGGEFCWPVPASSIISSGYGWRICPFHGNEFHAAIDIAAGMGSAVLAASGGTVIQSCYYGGFGNNIIVDHGGGVTTWYNHLSSRYVSVGQHVSKGQQIGAVGSTGSSTGPHLDFRVYVNGSSRNPMDYF